MRVQAWTQVVTHRPFTSTSDYEAVVPEIWFATDWKAEVALLPMLRTAPMQITTIKDNITAYSTAVGPSSDFKNLFNFKAKFFIVILRFCGRCTLLYVSPDVQIVPRLAFRLTYRHTLSHQNRGRIPTRLLGRRTAHDSSSET